MNALSWGTRRVFQVPRAKVGRIDHAQISDKNIHGEHASLTILVSQFYFRIKFTLKCLKLSEFINKL